MSKPCQSLFVAPCSHVWHYKCIRPILQGPTSPHFLCPNCRAVADLDAEVDEVGGEWAFEIDGKCNGIDNTVFESKLESGSIIGVAAPMNPSGPMASKSSDNIAPSFNVTESLRENGGSNPMGLPQPELAEVTAATHGQASSSPSASRMLASDGEPTHSGPAARATNLNAGVEAGVGQHSATAPILSSVKSQSKPIASNGVLGSEGPLTPTNDVGPFVFNGSSGNFTPNERVIASLNEAASMSSERDDRAEPLRVAPLL